MEEQDRRCWESFLFPWQSALNSDDTTGPCSLQAQGVEQPPYGWHLGVLSSGLPPSLSQPGKEIPSSPSTCPCGWSADAAAYSLQLCPTLCDPIDSSPAGSPDPGILQARTLEWVAISLLQCVKVKSESQVAQSSLTGASRSLLEQRVSSFLCIWFSNIFSIHKLYKHTFSFHYWF